jgi:CRISPR-associated protein Csc1
MNQLELPLQISNNSSEISFKRAKLIELWCAEPVFFASRELSDTYYTEGVIGNYALAYAFGWAKSPYRLTGKATGRPTYLEDLIPISQQMYVLPAWSKSNSVNYRFERFNALSDSYWYAMTNNRVATAREELPLQRAKGQQKIKSFRPSNFPQVGRLRMIERGNTFETIVLGDVDLPEYIRVGKFMSKVRVTITAELDVISLSEQEYESNAACFNTADLPHNLNLLAFDLIAIPPVSLIKNLRFRGKAWQIGELKIPANLKFFGEITNND